ncbi:MAG: hypothetical protein J6Q65_01595 [Lentisphaeria bacterium]|nr:hypothetical protein [Lentisphaeria bacterium]
MRTTTLSTGRAAAPPELGSGSFLRRAGRRCHPGTRIRKKEMCLERRFAVLAHGAAARPSSAGYCGRWFYPEII